MYYIYDKTTGELISSVTVEIPETARYGITSVEPPNVDEPHKTVVFDRNEQQWKIVDDYRGIWYNKETKEILVVKKLGVVVDLTKYTDKEPCDFCIWNEDIQDWEFSLDLYKEYAIKKLQEEYFNYLFSKEPLPRQIGFTALITRALIVLNTNKSLTDEHIDELSNMISESNEVFVWITKVVQYEDDLEKQILNATTKEEIDNILSNINFKQFDDVYEYVPLAPKMISLAQIELVSTTTDEGDVSNE